MKIYEKYAEALKTFNDFITVSEWAQKVSEMYPDLYKKAEKEAREQKNDTTGLREIAARDLLFLSLKVQSSSPAKCSASADEPPLPAIKTFPPLILF